jgi:hypothetical protein
MYRKHNSLRTPVAAISVREILSRKINPDFRGKAF